MNQLDQSEVIDERPFTHPEQSTGDLATLREMAEILRQQIGQLNALPWSSPQPMLFYLREASGQRHRIIVVDPGGLATCEGLLLVGFFGHKRDGADGQMVDRVDVELCSELLQNPHFLSYSSREMGGGNWANLVLLSSMQGVDHWMASVRHVYASQELAPQYYDTIRLHNGLLPGGLAAINQMALSRTKYYDYRDGAVWRAVRELAT